MHCQCCCARGRRAVRGRRAAHGRRKEHGAGRDLGSGGIGGAAGVRAAASAAAAAAVSAAAASEVSSFDVDSTNPAVPPPPAAAAGAVRKSSGVTPRRQPIVTPICRGRTSLQSARRGPPHQRGRARAGVQRTEARRLARL